MNTSTLLLSVEHQHSYMFDYVMIAWAEMKYRTYGGWTVFSVCAKEIGNINGVYENVVVVSIISGRARDNLFESVDRGVKVKSILGCSFNKSKFH